MQLELSFLGEELPSMNKSSRLTISYLQLSKVKVTQSSQYYDTLVEKILHIPRKI